MAFWRLGPGLVDQIAWGAAAEQPPPCDGQGTDYLDDFESLATAFSLVLQKYQATKKKKRQRAIGGPQPYLENSRRTHLLENGYTHLLNRGGLAVRIFLDG